MQDKMYIDENLSDGLDLDEEDFGLKFSPSELILLPLLQDLEKKYRGLQIHEICRLPPRLVRLPAASFVLSQCQK